VAEIEGEIAGYAYAGPYRARPAYHWSVEDSIYVAPQSHRRGVGRALIERLIADAAAAGFRQMIAVIGDSANTGSIELHRRAGLPHGGYVRQCRLQVRTLARQRPDAAPAWGRCDDRSLVQAFGKSLKAIVVSGPRYPATTLSDVSMECSTRSSSWPRRTIRPVAEITL
jgi:GNAT superfamily N-acetyltransferase